jgi:hypothetical protein
LQVIANVEKVKNKRREGKKGRKTQLQVRDYLEKVKKKKKEGKKERHKDTIASNG